MIDWGTVRALTFDCYGTLVDWESGLARDLAACLVTRSGKSASTYYDGEELLRFYSLAEPAAQAGPFRPYREVLKTALLRIADAAHLKFSDIDALARGLPSWPVFADTRAALATLETRFRLGVVANVDQDLFDETAPALGVRFGVVVTSDQVGAYKPSPKLFEEAVRRLGLDKSSIVHVGQSMFHDIEPASVLGIRSVLVDRRNGRPGGATPRATASVAPDLKVRSLEELAAAACG